jgi:hypothetical protein
MIAPTKFPTKLPQRWGSCCSCWGFGPQIDVCASIVHSSSTARKQWMKDSHLNNYQRCEDKRGNGYSDQMRKCGNTALTEIQKNNGARINICIKILSLILCLLVHLPRSNSDNKDPTSIRRRKGRSLKGWAICLCWLCRICLRFLLYMGKNDGPVQHKFLKIP